MSVSRGRVPSSAGGPARTGWAGPQVPGEALVGSCPSPTSPPLPPHPARAPPPHRGTQPWQREGKKQKKERKNREIPVRPKLRAGTPARCLHQALTRQEEEEIKGRTSKNGSFQGSKTKASGHCAADAMNGSTMATLERLRRHKQRDATSIWTAYRETSQSTPLQPAARSTSTKFGQHVCSSEAKLCRILPQSQTKP